MKSINATLSLLFSIFTCQKMDERVKQYKQAESSKEKIKLFDAFAAYYDSDVREFGYDGAKVCADVVAKYAPTINRDKLQVLDVASGTGLVGEELVKHGFQIIDGLYPAEGMNRIARAKGIYRTIYEELLTAEPLTSIASGSYDVITVGGGYQHAQLPCDSILGMIPLTKPGGIICITARQVVFYEYEEYKDFIPLCDKLEMQNTWKKIDISNFDGFNRGVVGTSIVYRVL